MASVNKAIIMGNLGAAPELRYTAAGTPVATFNVATTEHTEKNGQKVEKTEWHRIVVWGKTAENCAKYLEKGKGVFIEGKIQTRTWEDQNGIKRYSTEIVALMVQFLASSGGGARPPHPAEQVEIDSEPSASEPDVSFDEIF